MNENTTTFLRKLETFSTDVADELASIQEELREIDVKIRQSTSEVERLAKRNARLQNKVRQMEEEMASWSRDDMRALYTAAQKAQMRLFMMRSQVEQLQNSQRQLERYEQELQRFVNLTQERPGELAVVDDAGMSERGGVEPIITRVIEAQERDRRHLARQMHDGPAQSLTNLILQAEICERLFETDPERAQEELESLKNAANSTFQKVREFIFDLRPMMLDDLGLVPTFKRYVNAYKPKADFEISLQISGEERRLPDTAEVTVFRAMQELLQNAANHAEAHHVQVQLDLRDSDVTLVVEDDGDGFDVDEVLHAPDRRTVGLPALQERIDMLGGELQIDSDAGRGTRARVYISTEHLEEAAA